MVRARGTGGGGGAPPSYSQLSPHFGDLEKTPEDYGNGQAILHLMKVKLAFIAAYASKANSTGRYIREFLEAGERGGVHESRFEGFR